MKTFAITALSIAALSLSACATLAPHGVEDTPLKMKDIASGAALLSGIDTDKVALDGASLTTLSRLDPTCVSFYKNAATFADASSAIPDVGVKIPGGGFGTSLLKTIAFGTVAGAASGGIGSLGIGSSFLELALAGAANQVVFQGSNAAFNAVTSGGAEKAAKLAALSPLQKIESAATQIGCPSPSAAALGVDSLSSLSGGTTSDHTHSAGEHTHTKDGHTYSHTH